MFIPPRIQLTEQYLLVQLHNAGMANIAFLIRVAAHVLVMVV